MRTLHVSAVSELGGAERSLVELVGRLQSDHEIEPLVVLPAPGGLSAALDARGVAWRTAPLVRIERGVVKSRPFHYFQCFRHAARQLAATARAYRVRIIHANDFNAVMYSETAARKLARRGWRIPVLWHCRDLLGSGLRWLKTGTNRRISPMIAISRAVAENLLSGGVPSDRVHTILNGLDLSPYTNGSPRERARMRREIRQELGVPDNALVVGSAGVFVPWKRYEDFLDAIRLLDDSIAGRPVQALLAGSDLFNAQPTYTQELARRAAGRAKLIGWREDMATFYAALDVFVWAAPAEPFGRVLVEAMASGLPVVAARGGAVQEIVVDGETGLLVEPHDPSALAAACRRLLGDEALRLRMGAAGRARAKACFSLERCAREVAGLLHRLT